MKPSVIKTINYFVSKPEKPFLIDGNWNKAPWKTIEPLFIANDNKWLMSFKPHTEVKVCYDDENVYVIFRVKDQYIKCLTERNNGPVWEDSCVEFFFAPNPEKPENYFNIEVNCKGFAYMAFNRVARIDYDLFSEEDIKKTKIVHTLRGSLKKEILKSLDWFVEYKLPFEILAKYDTFQKPEKNSTWSANFFKCAENNSHPHWLSWGKVDSKKPDFHLRPFRNTITFN